MDKMIFSENRYFTAGERVSAMGVDVFGCGHFSTTGRRLRPVVRTVDCFGITLLEKGCGFFASDMVPRTVLQPGDLFILFPGEEHCFGPRPDDYWQEYWLLFDGSTVRHLLRENLLAPARTLYRTGRGHPVERVLRAAHRHSTTDPALLPADILRILGLLGAQAAPPEGTPVGGIMELIRTHPERAFDFPRLAAEHGISYSLFRRDFTRRTGLPPQQYLIRERIHRARGYLAGGESVAGAGRLVGIEDQYYFSRMFKKVTGMSPRAFKNSLRSWKEGH